MEFDKTKVYTSLNADESLIGAKGYFAHKATTLKNTVERNCKSNYATVEEINSDNEIIFNKKKWNFFYLVEPVLEKNGSMTEEELKATVEEYVKSRTMFIPFDGKHFEFNEIYSLLEDAFEDGYKRGYTERQKEKLLELFDKCEEFRHENAELKARIEQLEKDYCNADELCNKQALEITELKNQIDYQKDCIKTQHEANNEMSRKLEKR